MNESGQEIWARLRRGYQICAILLLNTIIFLVVLDFGLFCIFEFRDHLLRRNPVATKYNLSLKEFYPDLSEEEFEELLDETWSRPLVYAPYTQFRERHFHGKYVNVEDQGYRFTKNQGPWPPDPSNLNIFLFGGSTAFGYGVRDAETIASYLQTDLEGIKGHKVKVYNFACGYYYSTQERTLFEKLLAEGARPDLAIFIDGLNEFYYDSDEPLYTERLEQEFAGTAHERGFFNSERFSLYRAAAAAGRWWRARRAKAISPAAASSLEAKEAEYDRFEILERMIARYQENKRMIEATSAAHRVQAIFVWQPVPTYDFDLRNHPFATYGFGKHAYSKYGYPRVERLVGTPGWGNNFLWCARIQEKLQGPLYVDLYHYSAKMSEGIAGCISAQLVDRHFLRPRMR